MGWILGCPIVLQVDNGLPQRILWVDNGLPDRILWVETGCPTESYGWIMGSLLDSDGPRCCLLPGSLQKTWSTMTDNIPHCSPYRNVDASVKQTKWD